VLTIKPEMYAIFLLFALLILNSSFAQTDSVKLSHKNSITITYGFVHNRIIDEGYTDSRLLFRGTNSKLRIDFTHDALPNLFNFTLEASLGKVRSRQGNLPSELTQANITLEYFRRLKKYQLFGREGLIFAGISGSSRISRLANSPVIDNTDFLTMQGIYLGAMTRIKLSETQHLQIAYLVPTVVSIGRILYSEADFSYQMQNNPLEFLRENSQTTYFALSDLIQLKAGYVRKFTRSTSFMISYAFFFAKSNFKAPISLYSNELLLGLKFGL
jgi:hypothetical protein